MGRAYGGEGDNTVLQPVPVDHGAGIKPAHAVRDNMNAGPPCKMIRDPDYLISQVSRTNFKP